MKKQSLLMFTLVIGLSLLLALPLYAGDRKAFYTPDEARKAAPQVDAHEMYEKVLKYRQSEDKKAYGPPPSFTVSNTGGYMCNYFDTTNEFFATEFVGGGVGVSAIFQTYSGLECELPQIPTGALVFGFEIESCDVDPFDEIFASLLVGPSPAGFPGVINSFGTGVGATPGCFWSSVGTNFIVDNYNNHYWIEIIDGNPFGNGTAFNLGRLWWLRVVSPPFQQTFFDVLPGNPIFPFVEALAASGITGGCGGGNYCPNNPLTRGQMAVFLSAALGLHWPG